METDAKELKNIIPLLANSPFPFKAFESLMTKLKLPQISPEIDTLKSDICKMLVSNKKEISGRTYCLEDIVLPFIETIIFPSSFNSLSPAQMLDYLICMDRYNISIHPFKDFIPDINNMQNELP